MRRRDRFLALAALILVIGGVKLCQQLYRWLAFGEEREAITQLQEELTTAGLEVIRTHLQADSLRAEIEGMDHELGISREELDRYERRVRLGGVTSSLETEYRGDLADYNHRVGERNEIFDRWRSVVDRNHASVDRFNALADSIRAIADRMGEPYYPIPSPAEIAARNGIPLAEGASPAAER